MPRRIVSFVLLFSPMSFIDDFSGYTSRTFKWLNDFAKSWQVRLKRENADLPNDFELLPELDRPRLDDATDPTDSAVDFMENDLRVAESAESFRILKL